MTRSLSKTKPAPIAPQQKLSALHARFGEPHLLLAYHSAPLLVITPDLMYRLWATFYQDSHGVPLNIPWIAVSDFLLNVPNRELGKESYKLDANLRRSLLLQLRQHPRLGQRRLREIAAFILTHIQPQLNSPNSKVRHAAEAQRWTALAYTQPDLAAQELATALADLSPHNITEWRRLTTLVETLATELATFQPLLTYATAMKNFMCFTAHDAEATAQQLRPVLDTRHHLQVAGVNLPIPEAVQASFPQPRPVKSSQEKTPWLIGFSMAALIVSMGLGANQFNSWMKNRSPSLPNPIVASSTKPAPIRKKLVMYTFRGPSSYPSSYDEVLRYSFPVNSSIRFDSDFSFYLSQYLNFKLDRQVVEFDDLIPALQLKRADFVMSGITLEKEKTKDLEFSDPYYEYSNQIIVKEGINLSTEQDLMSKKVGVMVNSLEEEYIISFNIDKGLASLWNKVDNSGKRIRIVQFGTVAEMAQALRTGQIDAALTEPRASEAVGFNANSFPDFNFIPNSQSTTKFAVIFPKGSSHAAEFNRGIREMKQDGVLDRLTQKWFGYQKKNQ